MSDRVTWGGAGRDLGPPLASAAAARPQSPGRGADLPPLALGRPERWCEHMHHRLAREAQEPGQRPQEGLSPSGSGWWELLPSRSTHSDGLRALLFLRFWVLLKV
ncbi:uncharacterized protein V5649_011883 [Rhynchonycteris naso]